MLRQVDVGVQDPDAYEEFVERVLYLLRTPGEAVRIGATGRERVRDGFLITRVMRDEMRMLASL